MTPNGIFLQEDLSQVAPPRNGPANDSTLWLQHTSVKSCLHQTLPKTHREVWLSLLCSHCTLLLSPVCTKLCLCPPGVSVSPALWKFCYQISLTFKVRFPGHSQATCWISQPGQSRNFTTVWELLSCNCSPVCVSPAWLLCGGTLAASSKRTNATCCAS